MKSEKEIYQALDFLAQQPHTDGETMTDADIALDVLRWVAGEEDEYGFLPLFTFINLSKT
jgi:hypothetical protein